MNEQELKDYFEKIILEQTNSSSLIVRESVKHFEEDAGISGFSTDTILDKIPEPIKGKLSYDHWNIINGLNISKISESKARPYYHTKNEAIQATLEEFPCNRFFPSEDGEITIFWRITPIIQIITSLNDSDKYMVRARFSLGYKETK